MTGEIFRALKFAAAKHRNQRRKDKGKTPYVNHLIDVADLLCNVGGVKDTEVIVAGILHDTIEDTETYEQEIREVFGETVAQYVLEVTDDKSLPVQERKRLQVVKAAKSSFGAKQIKLADKCSNVRDLVDAPPHKWPKERILKYVDWAEQVINRMRGTNESLENLFDSLAERCRKATK